MSDCLKETIGHHRGDLRQKLCKQVDRKRIYAIIPNSPRIALSSTLT